MVLSALLYAALVAALLGASGCARPLPRLGLPTRRRAAGVFAVAMALAAAVALWPTRDRFVESPATRLDALVPTWQFGERHEIRVRASPAEVEDAIRRVTAREIRFFLPLTWLRRPRLDRRPGGDILSPPADRPILDVALGTTFVLLAEEPGREIVFGTLVIRPDRASGAPRPRPDEFIALAGPGYAKALMNFSLTDEGDGWTRLVTETRVLATDAASGRRFAVYWRLIYPGSSLIRTTWLAAIRDRAEVRSGAAAESSSRG